MMANPNVLQFMTPRIVALFEIEVRNEESMIRDARRRDEIPPPTTIDTVLDSVAQGVDLPDGWDTGDWLGLIEVIRVTGRGSKVEDILAAVYARQQADA